MKYHKIDSPFVRDMEGTKKLIEGEFRDPIVEYIAGNEWIFTEKVDGTNVRIMWDGHNITFGGRTEKAQMPVHLLNRLQDIFFADGIEEIFEQKFGEIEVTLFGEGFGEKIQKGGGLYGSVDFILFDVAVGGMYLKRGDVESIGKAFGLRVVPILLEGTLQEGIDYVKSPDKLQSRVADEPKDIEGLIGTPKVRIHSAIGKRTIVKVKVKDFNN